MLETFCDVLLRIDSIMQDSENTFLVDAVANGSNEDAAAAHQGLMKGC